MRSRRASSGNPRRAPSSLPAVCSHCQSSRCRSYRRRCPQERFDPRQERPNIGRRRRYLNRQGPSSRKACRCLRRRRIQRRIGRARQAGGASSGARVGRSYHQHAGARVGVVASGDTPMRLTWRESHTHRRTQEAALGFLSKGKPRRLRHPSLARPRAELHRNPLHDLPSPRPSREHQRLRERRLDDVAKLYPRSVAVVRFAALVTRALALAADRFAPLRGLFIAPFVRFALVDSPTEKANAS